MKKKYETYQELVDEKQKLENLLNAQKELVRADVELLKVEVKPLTEIVNNVRKFTTRDKVNLAVALSSDIIARKVLKGVIMAKAGRFGKLVVPYFFKNYTSSFLKEQTSRLIRRIKSIIKNKSENSYMSPTIIKPPDEPKT